jgi:hypothetical protein
VQKDGAKAAGDFARTSGGLANQKKILAAQIENVSAKVGSVLLPVITSLVTWFNDRALPALTSFGDGVKKVAGFVNENKVAISILIGSLAALMAITKLHAAVMAVQAAGGLLKYLAATKLVTTATKVWTAVQWALNAVMRANPIGIVITVLALLVAGIVIAYKKSETFRNIVDGALRAVGKAAKWLWSNAFSPAFGAVKTIIRAVGDAGIWLWNKALAPAFRAILRGVGWILDGWAKMLRALAKIPGFEWADRAADKLQRAADKARRVADGIRDIPTRKDVSIYVTTYTARRNIDTGPGGGGGRAHGTTNFPGGAAWVGEQGPELVSLPKGTRIWSAARSERMVGSLGGRGGGDTYLTVNVNGALDPIAVGRQIEQIMVTYQRSVTRQLAFSTR